MGESTGTLIVNTGDGERRLSLAPYLDPDAAERAERDANAWIKSLREVPIDGRPLRDRFLFRLSYIDYNYDYSGSGWHIGAPKPLDASPVLGFPTYDSAKMITASFTVKF